MTIRLSRRSAIGRSLLLPYWGLIPGATRAAVDAGDKNGAHFFLHIFFPGGMDATYTFDARPLRMTTAKLQTNYLMQDPKAFIGKNGGISLRTPLTDPLMPFMHKFSILNGILMAQDFDGHEDNQSLLLTGNPLGGDSYLNAFGGDPDSTPLRALALGAGMVSDSRVASTGMLRLNRETAMLIAAKARDMPSPGKDRRLRAFFQERFTLDPEDLGSRAKAKLLMGDGHSQIPSINGALRKLKMEGAPNGEELPVDLLRLAMKAFDAGLSRAAMIVFDTDLSENQNLDAHDQDTAREQPRIIGGLMQELAELLALLEGTEYAAGASFLDVTTVLVTSEFSRTMRQSIFEESGTDHNALTNTALIGGKGIQGGLVVGASDFQAVDDLAHLSGAHLEMNPGRDKIMGRPFDFAAGRLLDKQPAAFELADYLTAGSVINTTLAGLGIDKRHWRQTSRSGNHFPVIKHLLG